MFLSGYWPQIVFTAVFGSILYFGWQNIDEEPQTEEERYDARIKNVRCAFFFVMLTYFIHRTFDPNIKELFKPFQRIWRVFANTCYFYLYVLIFVYLMNHHDARKMWSLVESRLGNPVDKSFHTYDDDCEITWDNLMDNMDHYFLAHFTNWFLAAIILRDSYMLHFWSILDEILELSAQYKLPHFRE